MAASDREEGLALLSEMLPVSRETIERLDRFAGLLTRWQTAKNLVGRSTLERLWTRHIADSAQPLAICPEAKRWVDLGSGAGLPGMVIAILLADTPGAEVHLVESNGRKCAFLRAAVHACAAPAVVCCERIEAFTARADARFDAVSARALGSLDKLIDLAAPLIVSGAVGIFHRGQDLDTELTAASICWNIETELVPSRTHPGSALVVLRDCTAKTA